MAARKSSASAAPGATRAQSDVSAVEPGAVKESTAPGPVLGAPPAEIGSQRSAGSAVTRDLNGSPPTPTANDISAPPPLATTTAAATESGTLELSLQAVQGCITQIPSQFTVLGRYKSTQPSGALRLFDQLLGSWIEHALELGIIDMEIGELFFIPAKKLGSPAETVVLAGMGEPGRFNLDDLTYLMQNVAYAIKSLGENEFCMSLIESGRAGIGKQRAISAMIDGVRNALKRFPGPGPQTLRIRLVVEGLEYFDEVRAILADLADSQPVPDLKLTIEPPEKMAMDGASNPPHANDPDVGPHIPTTRITISRSGNGTSASIAGTGAQGSAPIDSQAEIDFQYSADSRRRRSSPSARSWCSPAMLRASRIG